MKQKISEREINNTLKENIRNRFTEKRNEINQKLIQKREMIQNKLREVIERQRQIKNIHGNRSNSNQTINDRLNSVIDKINASINNRPENNDTTQGLGNSNNRGGKNE
jgi:hypothetical protein